MARKSRYDYHFTPASNRKIRNAVARFNRAIDRMHRSPDYNGVSLPEKRTVREVKDAILNRNDLVRELRSLDAIKKGRAADVVDVGNVKTIRYVVKDVEQRLKVANRRREEERKKIARYTIPDGRGGEVEVPDLHEGYNAQDRTVDWDSIEDEDEFFDTIADIYDATGPSYDEEQARIAYENYLNSIMQWVPAETVYQLMEIVEGAGVERFLELQRSGELPTEKEWYAASRGRGSDAKLEVLLYQFKVAFGAAFWADDE